MISRDVFHIRLKDIEIQAERLIDPSMKKRAIAIISSTNSTGSVRCVSKEAKQQGIFVGMKVSIARKIDHRIQLLPYNRTLYHQINNYIYRSISSFTPIVEPEGFGTFFLDMNGMESIRGSMKNIASSIINNISDKTNLFSTVGISTNKLVSRIVTNVVPNRIYKVHSGRERKFLAPLDPTVLPVGREKIINRLLKFLWIKNVGQVQSITKDIDTSRIFFGIHSTAIIRQSNGYDTSLVKPIMFKDHIIEQTIIPQDTNDITILNAVVRDLSEQVALKLYKRRQIARKLRLEIHYTDGYKVQKLADKEKINYLSIVNTCRKLFIKANQRRNRIRTILIDAWDFYPHTDQGNLFCNKEEYSTALLEAIHKIRSKYGSKSIRTIDVFHALKET